jgi:hypothetical protein
MNALISLKPSESEMKSLIWAIDNALPLEPCGADASGAPSKKNSTGICCNRLAPMRLAPLSYFCTCWKVRPSAAPSFSWLIASIMRGIRTRLSTYWSVGFGPSFAAIVSEPPWLKLAKAMSKKSLGHSASRFNEQFLDEGLSEFDFLDDDLHFLDGHLWIYALG